jgi:hypothetical protein
LNSSGSQLIGVRYVQVGLEERENLTVTWNVSIAIRSLCVTLLAAILALVLVVTLAEDADARKVRRKKGVADFRFSQTFEPPDRFSCSPGSPRTPTTAAAWDPPTIQPPKPIHGYICTAVGSVVGTQAPIFDLNDVLERAIGSGPNFAPPPGPLAAPDVFHCHWVPSFNPANGVAVRSAENFSCEFPENQQTCHFTIDQLVATNIDEVDDESRVVRGKKDLDRIKRVVDPTTGAFNDIDGNNDLFLPLACHAVPTAVPAGADAAGEGPAAWLFGLVLAAGGALVGSVVIARRRFLHDS